MQKILSTNTKGDSNSTASYTYLNLCKFNKDVILVGLGFRCGIAFTSGKAAARIYNNSRALIVNAPSINTALDNYTYSNFSPILMQANTSYYIGLYGEKISNYDKINIKELSNNYLSIQCLGYSDPLNRDGFVACNSIPKFVIDMSFVYLYNGSLFLINDGNDLLATEDGNAFSYKDILPYSIDKFDNHGMIDLSKINPIIISKLVSNKFSIDTLK